MKCNLALWDRLLRFLFGVSLTSYAVAGGPAWCYLGLYFLLSAGWGYCLIYAFFDLRTR